MALFCISLPHKKYIHTKVPKSTQFIRKINLQVFFMANMELLVHPQKVSLKLILQRSFESRTGEVYILKLAVGLY